MRSSLRRMMRWSFAAIALAGIVVATLLALAAERAIGGACPFPIERLAEFPQSTRILARDGALLRISAVDGERRIARPLAAFSQNLVSALIAAEDRRFDEHSGVDWLAITRAAFDDLRARRIVSGASTLTSQLVRIVEPRPRTFMAKVVEAFRARQLERLLTKDQILEYYLNLAPLGSGVRGFEAGAQFWYGKHASELAADEAATLVALLPAPSRRAPTRDNAAGPLLKAARDRVLARMRDRGDLTAADCERMCASKITAERHDWPFAAPHFCDGVIRRAPLAGGDIVTDLDSAMQSRIESIVAADAPDVDGTAIVVLDRRSGSTRAIVGGRDWNRSHVDASSQRRDVGSTLKPFLYAAALSNGIAGPDALIADRAKVFGDYSPGNFDGTFTGSLRVKDALVQSRNLPAVEILERLTPQKFRSTLRSLGLRVRPSALTLDAALGTSSYSPRELAEAWRRFADPGFAVAEADAGARSRVLAMLSDGHALPGSPSAGGYDDASGGRVAWKTGTSSGRRDAWCVGVTPRYSIVVWLGNLDGKAARRGADLVGVRVAAPLFARIVAAIDPFDY